MIPNYKNFPEESEAKRLSKDGKSEHDRLVDILDELSLFRDPHGAVWVRLPDAEIKIVYPLRSAQLRDWLEVEYRRRHCHLRAPRDYNIRSALRSTRARAAATGCREFPIFHRHLGWGFRAGPAVTEPVRVILDLAGPHGQVLEITADGAEVVPGEHCHFERNPQMQELPQPRRPKDRKALLRKLRHLLRPASDRDFHRLLAWLHAALHPSGPYPVLVLHGDFHQASTVAYLLRSAIDPVSRYDNRFPSTDSQLDRATHENWILYFAAVNRITPRRAAALCSLAVNIRRPVIVTLARKNADKHLLENDSLEPLCLTVEIASAGSDFTAWPTLEELTPDVLGLLVGSVSAAIANLPAVAREHANLPPRLHDACLWTMAAAEILDLTQEQILAAFAPDEIPPPEPTENTPTFQPSEIKPKKVEQVARLATPAVMPVVGASSTPAVPPAPGPQVRPLQSQGPCTTNHRRDRRRGNPGGSLHVANSAFPPANTSSRRETNLQIRPAHDTGKSPPHQQPGDVSSEVIPALTLDRSSFEQS